MSVKQSPGLDRKIEELLNRKPSKWGNISIKTFEQDIELLQKVVRQQQHQEKTLRFINKVCITIIDEQRNLQKEESDEYNEELLDFAWNTNNCISDIR